MNARVLVVTGTRAEFGLLEPVMRAIDAHDTLDLLVAAGGAHLLPPARTIDTVRTSVRVDVVFEMQRPGETGRLADARALGRGVSALTDAIERLRPDWVVVLGDRIEAFAAAAAASVAGVAVAHLHGGDRAEGVADEAMRHAISKLAHLHLPATETSAQRLVRMGENPAFVRVVGSPAIDALAGIEAIDDAAFTACGAPDTIFLMHPVGRTEDEERQAGVAALMALRGRRVLALHPNSDPGRAGIVAAIRDAGVLESAHMERDSFLALLKRLAQDGGVIVGNSSGALIECAALGLPAVNIADRQSGRETSYNVISCDEDADAISSAVDAALAVDRSAITHPYGDGNAGQRTAEAIAACERDHDRARLIRKRNAY